jgi:hypothetical protein
MESFDLSTYTKGWFVGDFEPTLVPSKEIEVGIKRYSAGDKEPRHHHRVATELTAIVSGKVQMSGRVYSAGQIVRIPPNESTDFEALEDTVTVVVKYPFARDDKFPG